MLIKRALSGFLLAVFVLTIILLSHCALFSFLMPLAIMFIAVMGLLEFFDLMEKKGAKTLKAFGVISSVIYIWYVYISSCNNFNVFCVSTILHRKNSGDTYPPKMTFHIRYFGMFINVH